MKAKRGNEINEEIIKLEKSHLIKVEIIFVGTNKLLNDIKEHLASSIQKEFIEQGEKFVIKSIKVLK